MLPPAEASTVPPLTTSEGAMSPAAIEWNLSTEFFGTVMTTPGGSVSESPR